MVQSGKSMFQSAKNDYCKSRCDFQVLVMVSRIGPQNELVMRRDYMLQLHNFLSCNAPHMLLDDIVKTEAVNRSVITANSKWLCIHTEPISSMATDLLLLYFMEIINKCSIWSKAEMWSLGCERENDRRWKWHLYLINRVHIQAWAGFVWRKWHVLEKKTFQKKKNAYSSL